MNAGFAAADISWASFGTNVGMTIAFAINAFYMYRKNKQGELAVAVAKTQNELAVKERRELNSDLADHRREMAVNSSETAKKLHNIGEVASATYVLANSPMIRALETVARLLVEKALSTGLPADAAIARQAQKDVTEQKARQATLDASALDMVAVHSAEKISIAAHPPVGVNLSKGRKR